MKPEADTASETAAAVAEELERCREQVVARIAKARKLTDSEVLGAGRALDEVVQIAKGYMGTVNERMSKTAESGGGVGSRLSGILRVAKVQEEQVAKALENLDAITKAGRKIREASGASRLLALNARVESARFGGEGGRAFNVIADEMRELSVSVETTNLLVSKLANQLRSSLPHIQDQTKEMGRSVEELVGHLEEKTTELSRLAALSAAAGNEALDAVLAAAQRGLGHLQFQDLMIQDLEGIERLLKRAHEAVLARIDPDGRGSDSAQDAFLGTIGADLDDAEQEPEIEAGEVLLF